MKSPARWHRQGYRRIAGVDEVGRGPLAGPVVAAAVILPDGFDAEGITDSKALSASRRKALVRRIVAGAEVGVAYVPAPAIDRLNIHGATLLAMRRAIEAMPAPPDAVLCDGKFVPKGLACPGEAVIKGDSKVLAIAAASIIAKVARDAMMEAAETHFPGYFFCEKCRLSCAGPQGSADQYWTLPAPSPQFRALPGGFRGCNHRAFRKGTISVNRS
jgi:ribonuclease HII